MQGRPQQVARDRAILVVRLATLGGVASALGLTWLFSSLAATYFSGKPAAAHIAAVPQVPVLLTPVQAPPPVITTVVHHQGQPSSGGSVPRPPGQGPRPAPPPPAAPACHSTPSKPC